MHMEKKLKNAGTLGTSAGVTGTTSGSARADRLALTQTLRRTELFPFLGGTRSLEAKMEGLREWNWAWREVGLGFANEED